MGTNLSVRQKSKYRIRKKVFGTSGKPRLSVYKSNAEIYAQLIDDNTGTTLVSASSLAKDIAACKGTKTEISSLVGKALAQKAKDLKIEEVVFDRNGFLYHGRIKALAEGAREGGLKF